MKLLLTCPPIFNHVYTPSLPLGYLKAYVQKNAEVEVKVLDLEYSYFCSPFIKKRVSLYFDKMAFCDHGMKEEEKPIYDKFVSQIIAEKPDAVGFSVAHSNFEITRYISQKLKYICSKVYIIYGGRYFCVREPYRPWVAIWHKNFLDVDCIVKNEGEETLCELVKTLKNGIKPTFCKGTTLRSSNGAIIDGGNRDLIKNLDTIPFPDFSDFPRENYLSDYMRMLFSRGCIGRCAYCVENDMMGTIRYRSPGNVVDELKLRLSQGYRKFQLCDLALNSCLRPLLDICQEIIANKLDVEFVFAEFRNAPGLTKDVFELLYKAGFRTLCFGTESGSQRILESMGKGIKVKTIDQNFKDAHSAGLKVIVYLMVGFPGETEETFLETIDLVSRNQEFLDGVTAISATEICASSIITDDPGKYGLNVATLYHIPDAWESTDGKNNLQWRRSLEQRLCQHFGGLRIPMTNFLVDGNPRIPKTKKKLADSERLRRLGQVSFSKNETEIAKLRSEYAAQLTVKEKYIITSVNKIVGLVVDIKNTGSKKWVQGEEEWFRVGCKIYNLQENNDQVFKELREEVPGDIASGEGFQVLFRIVGGSLPKGKYRLKFDIVNERKFWFEDLGILPFVSYIEL
ncbi:MAG: hypothetical protein AMJ95_08040 [Omnitrophica WOR_2 bacterium SM23_72]|nr:MAG: hypothetical protein AMJ95_08040 [Omnitrophica WOR_2 bacterium SM23_72]